jgi:GNAT superfamily N-acetyltransferase
LIIRTRGDQDSLGEITELLHRSYASLSEMGIDYKAAVQPAAETAKRISRGECLVAEHDGALVGTLTWRRPGRFDSKCLYYRRPGVATFEQFAVEPGLQHSGIGSALLLATEVRAHAGGAHELACDTAASAKDLVKWYANRGYVEVDRTRWPGKRYESVVLSKTL